MVCPTFRCTAWLNNIGTTDELYAGTDIGVFAWNGIGWDDFNIGLPNVEVFDLEIQETQNTLYAGTYGPWLVEGRHRSRGGLHRCRIVQLQSYRHHRQRKLCRL